MDDVSSWSLAVTDVDCGSVDHIGQVYDKKRNSRAGDPIIKN